MDPSQEREESYSTRTSKAKLHMIGFFLYPREDEASGNPSSNVTKKCCLVKGILLLQSADICGRRIGVGGLHFLLFSVEYEDYEFCSNTNRR